MTLKIGSFSKFIFPERCYICRDITSLGVYPLCKSCRKKISSSKLSRSSNEKVFFLGSAVEFNPTSQALIHKLKYGRKEILARIIGREIFNKVIRESKIKIDIVVSVPIHYKRQLWRGFNQTDLIAIEVAKLCKSSYSTSNLCKTKHTETQTKLNRHQRKDNVSDVFTVLNPILFKAKNILIVDDVITTGATIESCRATLLEHGAGNVYTTSFARA